MELEHSIGHSVGGAVVESEFAVHFQCVSWWGVQTASSGSGGIAPFVFVPEVVRAGLCAGDCDKARRLARAGTLPAGVPE